VFSFEFVVTDLSLFTAYICWNILNFTWAVETGNEQM